MSRLACAFLALWSQSLLYVHYYYCCCGHLITRVVHCSQHLLWPYFTMPPSFFCITELRNKSNPYLLLEVCSTDCGTTVFLFTTFSFSMESQIPLLQKLTTRIIYYFFFWVTSIIHCLFNSWMFSFVI